MGKTVKITLDCGDAGKVTCVSMFFRLIYGLNLCGGAALMHGRQEIESNLQAIAKRALFRA